MSILNKRSILKVATIFMLVAMMAGAFGGQSKAAMVARATTCGGTTTTNCTTQVGPNVAGLVFVSDAIVTITTGLATPGGWNSFSFTTTVTDTRGTTDGWQLQAANAQLTDGLGHTIDDSSNLMHIDADATATPVPTTVSCTITTDPIPTNSTCGNTPVIASTGLIGTPAPFVSVAATSTTPISGTFTINGHGKYYMPTGAFPGHYSAAITFSLVDTFAG